MMRLQYDSLITQIYKMVDEELELSTREGNEVFIALTRALYDFYVPQKLEREARARENYCDN